MPWVALRDDMFATSTAKPIAGEPGSAMHVHPSVLRSSDSQNQFSPGACQLPCRSVDLRQGATSGCIPLGGVVVGERVARALIHLESAFNHGFNYSGQPTACAVALANIGLQRELCAVELVREDAGPYLAAQFALLNHPALISEPRPAN